MANLLDLFNVQTPAFVQGLLSPEEQQKLQQKAATTGLINMAVGYLAQPKNQRFGSALPYLARAYTAGQEGAQGTYDDYLKNWQQQQQMKEFQRKQEADVATQEALKTLAARPEIANNPVALAWLKADPQAALKTFAMPKQQDLMKLGAEEVVYNPNTGTFVQSPVSARQKPTTKMQDYQFYANQEQEAGRMPKSFAEWDMSIESAKAPKSTTTVTLPPSEKAILDVDKETLSGLTTNANAARSIAVQTKTINSLIGNQPGSGIVKLSANLQNYLGIKSPEANVNDAITALANKAATEIRTPGSGSTSDLEFNAYRAAFPSLATSQAGRVLMGKIADANAKRMSKLADWARVNVQKGTFSYEGLAAYDDSLGQAVSDDIKKQVEGLTAGTNLGGSGSGWSIKEKK